MAQSSFGEKIAKLVWGCLARISAAKNTAFCGTPGHFVFVSGTTERTGPPEYFAIFSGAFWAFRKLQTEITPESSSARASVRPGISPHLVWIPVATTR